MTLKELIEKQDKEFEEKWQEKMHILVVEKRLANYSEMHNFSKSLNSCSRSEILEWVKEEIEKMAKWPEPQPGAGQEIGALYGAGMYTQYDYDKKKHEQALSDLLKVLEEKK